MSSTVSFWIFISNYLYSSHFTDLKTAFYTWNVVSGVCCDGVLSKSSCWAFASDSWDSNIFTVLLLS